jgi:transaldolase
MLFLDTANIRDVTEYLQWGCFRGVTTNQKIWQTSGQAYSKEKYHQNIKTICSLTKGPVSVELAGSMLDAVDEAEELVGLAGNVVIKVPMWPDGRGMKVINALVRRGVPVNATVLMKASQAILAAEAGAKYVSLFYRRMIDAGGSDYAKAEIQGTHRYLIDENIDSKIIAGSIRETLDIMAAFKAGADIVTIPTKFLPDLVNHPKTDETIAEFDAAWREYIKSG